MDLNGALTLRKSEPLAAIERRVGLRVFDSWEDRMETTSTRDISDFTSFALTLEWQLSMPISGRDELFLFSW